MARLTLKTPGGSDRRSSCRSSRGTKSGRPSRLTVGDCLGVDEPDRRSSCRGSRKSGRFTHTLDVTIDEPERRSSRRSSCRPSKSGRPSRLLDIVIDKPDHRSSHRSGCRPSKSGRGLLDVVRDELDHRSSRKSKSGHRSRSRRERKHHDGSQAENSDGGDDWKPPTIEKSRRKSRRNHDRRRSHRPRRSKRRDRKSCRGRPCRSSRRERHHGRTRRGKVYVPKIQVDSESDGEEIVIPLPQKKLRLEPSDDFISTKHWVAIVAIGYYAGSMLTMVGLAIGSMV